MSKKGVGVLLFIFFAFGIFIASLAVRGANTDIVINEVGATEATGYEWLEIYNRGEEAVNLTGWKFWEAMVNHALVLKQGDDFILDPGEFAIITQDDKKFLEKYPAVINTIFDSSWTALSEDGEEIGLKFGTGTNDFVEKFVYIGTDNFSLERIDPLVSDYTSSNWIEHESGNTVGHKNSVTVDLVPEGEEIPEEEIVFLEEIAINQAPQALIHISSSTIVLGMPIRFDASGSSDSDGTIVSYSWYFGDESIGEGVEASHTYMTTGTFAVELTVIDNMESGSVMSTTIHVVAGASEVQVEPLPVVQNEESSSDEDPIDVVEPLISEDGNEEVILPGKNTSTAKVVINEFVSNPQGGKEWIELLNIGTSTINLSGYKLYDGVGAIATLDAILDPQKFLLIEPDTNRLNNDGDSIALKNVEGEVVDQIAYGSWSDAYMSDNAPAAKKGNSVARKNQEDTDVDKDDFQETIMITKGSDNILQAPIVVQKISSSNVNSVSSFAGDTSTTVLSSQTAQHWGLRDIVINELLSDPAENQEEFVELFNNTNASVILDGAKLQDGSGGVTIFSGTIVAKGFFVVPKPKGNLNNDGDMISLLDPAGTLVDNVRYGNWGDGDISDNAVVAYDPMSLSRRIDGVDTDNDTEDFMTTLEITQGQSNVINQPVVLDETTSLASAEIFINEVFPNPTGDDAEDEFIEIFNPTNSKISLVGWKLQDESGAHYTIEQKVIEPLSCAVFARKVIHISLNNTGGDSISLIDPQGIVQDTIVYTDTAEEGQTFAKNEEGVFHWTTTKTPGEENIFTEFGKSLAEINHNTETKIAATQKVKKVAATKKAPKKVAGKKIVTGSRVVLVDVREHDKGESVIVEGVVTVLPGVLGSQYFYIADESAGVQIYMNKKEFPDLALGDKVRVSGEISEVYSETRINVKAKENIVVLAHGVSIVPPQVEIASIGELSEGRLIQITGEVTDVKTSYIFVDDGTAEIKVYFKEGAGITKEDVMLGTMVDIFGVVSQTNSAYQILPRGKEDIIVRASEGSVASTTFVTQNTMSPKNLKQYFVVVSLGFAALAGGFFAKAYGREILKYLRRIKQK